MKSLLKIYLKPMIDANIDYLVLGCTHYPYLMPLLIELLPSQVKIIDSGEAVARQTKTVLVTHDLLNNSSLIGKTEFFTNGNLNVLKSLIHSESDIEYLDF
jgi:glutamate racemase